MKRNWNALAPLPCRALLVVFICCGAKVIFSRLNRAADQGKASPALKSNPRHSSEAPASDQSADHIVDRHKPEPTSRETIDRPKCPQKTSASQASWQNMPQWAHEALENIDRQGRMPDELLEIASKKLHLALYSMMTWPTTNRDWKKSTPQYVLTFLGKTAEEIALRPSCASAERSTTQGGRPPERKSMRSVLSGWVRSWSSNSSTNSFVQ